MAQLKKEVKKYVKSYQTQKGARWKVVLPDGRGGQIREGGFIEESHAMSFACTEYTKVLLNKNLWVISWVMHHGFTFRTYDHTIFRF